ncbi:MAG: type 4a pilus biogenesis protein PilO [Candidatus Omnitrophica bacterium]|nr:type 4a pilus biogenesis protein PilO [Candidatus Omnitrophota bacterium]
MISMSFSKRERYIFIITIIFIAMALVYNFIFEPGLKKWQILNDEITAKKARMCKDIRLMKERDSIIQEHNRYAKSAKNISIILSDIENQADFFGIKTSNIKPGQAIEMVFYKEYNIELQIEGQMNGIIKFLAGLIKLPTLVALKKFDFRLISRSPSVFKGTIILSKIII